MSPMHQSTPQVCYRRKFPARTEETEKDCSNIIINLSRGRVDNQNCRLSRFSEIATKIQVCGDDSALHSQSDLDTTTSTRRKAEQSERQQETSPNNPIKLRTSVAKDELDRNEKQTFDSTRPSNEAMMEKEVETGNT